MRRKHFVLRVGTEKLVETDSIHLFHGKELLNMSTHGKEDQVRINARSLHLSRLGKDLLKKQFSIELNSTLITTSTSSKKLAADFLIYKEGDLILFLCLKESWKN